MDKSSFTPVPRKTLQKVIQEEEANGRKLAEEEFVDLVYKGIGDLDNSINTFKNCTQLSLSSNFIQRIPEIQLDKLTILSLGRNKIKYIKGLDFVAKTLEKLWLSYNEIEKLDSLKNMVNLKVLYIGNNMISKIDELNYLSGLSQLEDVVFKGNPFTLVDGNISRPVDKEKSEYFPEIKKRLTNVKYIDGELVLD